MPPQCNIAALCLSIFLVRVPPLSDNNLVLCTLFIILVSTSFFDFGYFDSTDHLFKFCVIFYLNKNIKHVNEVSITL